MLGGPGYTLSEAQRQLDSSQQQENSTRLDLLCLDQELKDAYHNHQQTKHRHALFKE